MRAESQMSSANAHAASVLGSFRLTGDIRDLLRADHDAAMALGVALRIEPEERRCFAQLAQLRRLWVIHTLAEEAVVYHALEGEQTDIGPRKRADERFIDHKLLECFLDRLSRSRPGTPQWAARLTVACKLIRRHVEAQDDEMFAELARHFDAIDLRDMGNRFELAREKFTVLEQAKAA